MTTCLILAAGNAERHNGGNKPLLEVNGETLLQRTSRLATEHGADRTVLVSHRKDLWDTFPTCPLIPEKRRWVTETLLCTTHAWPTDGRTIVMLGDVYFTEDAAEMLFRRDHWRIGYGQLCNIHALKWDSEHNYFMQESLRRYVEDTEKAPSIRGAGKLWRYIECTPEITKIDFGDETTDFDSPQEHERFVAKYASNR